MGEMDGFDGNPGIITIAATNRAGVLAVHARGKPLEPDVDLDAIARRTPGFSGARLENLMNEAAISAARATKSTIGWEQIDGAVDRIMVGLEKKGGNPQLKQKELAAYHEAGHAVVGALVPDYDQVQKITIIPRSNGAGGLTFFAPSEGRLNSGMYSRQYLESQLATALGGRLAEEIVYGEDRVTTGASNDIQQVANIANQMVTQWGMSPTVGSVTIEEPGLSTMQKMMLQNGSMWGEKKLKIVETEVERLVNNSYLAAKNILLEKRSFRGIDASTHGTRSRFRRRVPNDVVRKQLEGC